MSFASIQAGRVLFTAGLFLSIALGGCNSPAAVATPVATPLVTDVISSSDPPAGLTVAATAAPLPAPVLTQPRADARNTAAPPPTPTSIQTSTPMSSSAQTLDPDEPTPTDTPAPPTYTPPPPPPPVAGEHLFMQRPIPASAPSWTDKTYPYGSTRGGTLRPHTGVEFIVPTGTPVLAVAGGVVVAAGDDSIVAYGPHTNFYGNLVVIQLNTNDATTPVYALYGHLSEVHVDIGQPVATGDELGLSGASGIADGPHLHFEVRVGVNSYEATRNPLLWLIPLNGTGVVAGRITGSGGELLHEAPVALIREDGAAPHTATTSYALGEPNADSTMRENFALDDVVPGFYQAVVDTGTRRYSAGVWVYAGRVNWVEIVVGGN